MNKVKVFVANSDGSATLGINFDITGMGFNPILADNYTPFYLSAKTDENGSIVPWTKEDALTALAGDITEAENAFLEAAPGFISAV
jgi:hypothetical protein